MKSVSPAMMKMTSADVRAYGQEELSAKTKSTVKPSRLSVRRFAQFICAWLRLALHADLPRRKLGGGGGVSRSILCLSTRRQSIYSPLTSICISRLQFAGTAKLHR